MGCRPDAKVSTSGESDAQRFSEKRLHFLPRGTLPSHERRELLGAKLWPILAPCGRLSHRKEGKGAITNDSRRIAGRIGRGAEIQLLDFQATFGCHCKQAA